MTEQLPPEWNLTNGHAGASVAAAVYSPKDENMAVGLVLVENTLQMLEAIRMSLTVKNGRSLSMTNTSAPRYDPERQVDLTTFGKGYKVNTVSLEKVNAVGNARCYLHPSADDPRMTLTDFFYVAVENDPNVDALQVFGDHLNLGTPHAVLPAWYDYLLKAGTEAGLVDQLPIIGDEWKWAVRVDKNTIEWESVISTGLKEGFITIG